MDPYFITFLIYARVILGTMSGAKVIQKLDQTLDRKWNLEAALEQALPQLEISPGRVLLLHVQVLV